MFGPFQVIFDAVSPLPCQDTDQVTTKLGTYGIHRKFGALSAFIRSTSKLVFKGLVQGRTVHAAESECSETFATLPELARAWPAALLEVHRETGQHS